jgi:hypothetical protein
MVRSLGELSRPCFEEDPAREISVLPGARDVNSAGLQLTEPARISVLPCPLWPPNIVFPVVAARLL